MTTKPTERDDSPRWFRIRSSWPNTVVGRKLTDRRIAHYQKEDLYKIRHESMAERAKKLADRATLRSGNFVKMPDGRLVYSPE